MRVITQINPGHKEIYDDLFNTPPRERADRLRFLAMLGSLILKGNIPLYGGTAQPLVDVPMDRPDPHVAQEKDALRSRMAKRLAVGLMDQ